MVLISGGNMQAADFNFNSFNKSLNGNFTRDLDFCKALSLSYDSKTAITGTYIYNDKDKCKQYSVLNERLEAETSSEMTDYYYGVSPKVDGYKIIEAIKRLTFSTTKGLEGFISKYSRCFMLYEEHSKYLLDFAKHAIITMSLKYGIRLYLPENIKEKICGFDPYGEIVLQQQEFVELHGCPTQEMLGILSDYKFSKRDNAWHIDEKGISIDDVYSGEDNIELLSGRVFYSGVVIKPLEIHPPKEKYENEAIKNICIDFERSTFATVCAFDEVHINHPLLEGSKNNLILMLSEDDRAKISLNEALLAAQNEESARRCVNAYLKSCLNVNQIVVSANLISKGNLLLLGLRNSKNIDKGCFYPGINGNAEIRDDNVDFYSYSIKEDYPTINLQKKRIDFCDEIDREMQGEINLYDYNNSWLCYGFILSGQIPQKPICEMEILPKKRRLHFNIIFEYNTQLTHEEIQESRNKASEAYETTFFKGIRIFCYKNLLDYISKCVLSFFEWVLQNKDIWEAVALLAVVFLSITKGSIAEFSWFDWLSVTLAVLIIILNAFHIGEKHIKNKKWKRRCKKENCKTARIIVFRREKYQKLSKKISRLLDGECHPAAVASTKLYIEKYVYNYMNKK